MYARGAKHTFANEMMKDSVSAFMIKNFDLKHGMIMSFKIHLSENQLLHIGIFPDEEAADNAGRMVESARKQIVEWGAKIELVNGPLSDFMVAGNVTLDQLISPSG